MAGRVTSEGMYSLIILAWNVPRTAPRSASDDNWTGFRSFILPCITLSVAAADGRATFAGRTTSASSSTQTGRPFTRTGRGRRRGSAPWPAFYPRTVQGILRTAKSSSEKEVGGHSRKSSPRPRDWSWPAGEWARGGRRRRLPPACRRGVPWRTRGQVKENENWMNGKWKKGRY